MVSREFGTDEDPAHGSDHSFMHHDSQPYYLRLNDTWKKIDYDKPAASWMEPVKRGETTGMVEIPVNWEVRRR